MCQSFKMIFTLCCLLCLSAAVRASEVPLDVYPECREWPAIVSERRSIFYVTNLYYIILYYNIIHIVSCRRIVHNRVIRKHIENQP